jgi:DNA topoisomerase VI subunit B
MENFWTKLNRKVDKNTSKSRQNYIEKSLKKLHRKVGKITSKSRQNYIEKSRTKLYLIAKILGYKSTLRK